NAAAQLLLARVYLQCGYLGLAKGRFEAVTRLSPADAEGRIGLAQIWRRDYLKYLETRSLDRAIDNFTVATRLAPPSAEALHRLAPSEQRAFVDRFWRDADPDLASRENEAQLEYWSRVAQAYFLFFDAKRKEWDERGEIYVRYGPPQRVEYNPLADALPDAD